MTSSTRPTTATPADAATTVDNVITTETTSVLVSSYKYVFDTTTSSTAICRNNS